MIVIAERTINMQNSISKLREMNEFVRDLTKAHIVFVPVPVDNELEFYKLLSEVNKKLVERMEG